MIVGISGKIGSGKSRVASYLAAVLNGTIVSIAGPAKAIVRREFGARVEQVWGSAAQKETLLPCGLPAREVLWRYMEAARDIWPAVWVEAMKRRAYAVWHAQGMCPILVDDVRFEDEAKAIKDMGGILIRLTRTTGTDDENKRETGLDHWTNWDAVIINDAQTETDTCLKALEVCRRAGVV